MIEAELRLAEALRQGNQEVLGQLYDAYAPVLMGVISRIVEGSELAEEVLQETFMTIWTRKGDYNPSQGKILTWALAIAREAALHAVKPGQATSSALEGQLEENPVATGKVLEPEQNQELKLLYNLNLQERAVLDLIYLKGRSSAEVAVELGLTDFQLKQHLKSAFIKLKAERPL